MKKSKVIAWILAMIMCMSSLGFDSYAQQSLEENDSAGLGYSLVLDGAIVSGDTLISGGASVSSDEGIEVQPDIAILIPESDNDKRVIPDKFNTGCKGELKAMEELAGVVDGVQLVGGSNNTRRVLDFYYRNKEISGTVVFQNYDFSDYPFWGMHETQVTKKIHVVFNNCKFAGVTLSKTGQNVTYEFNNCSMKGLNGSNATINHCKFGGSYSDGIVPFQNMEINDCFFSDMTYISPEKEIHTDGTQIYGYADVDVQNVHYNNCRFEVPPLNIEGSKAYVNACIMLQMEYSNAQDVSFNDCIVNGGGYTIYARAVKSGGIIGNIKFDGISYGGASRYGLLYPDVDSKIDFENIKKTDTLYVASAWKAQDGTHLSVTNDTNQARTLLVITDQGEYTYEMEACKSGNSFVGTDTYETMPFDREIVIKGDCNYLVCYDATIEGYAKQIRLVNWSGEDVYLSKSRVDELTKDADGYLLTGTCGKNVSFTLTKKGVLTLSGNGYTDNFHSKKFPLWEQEGYSDFVKEVVVEEGIEGLGAMIFQNCGGIEKITLPDSLRSMGQYTFRKCVCVEEVTLPASLESLGRSVFGGVSLKKIYYKGDDWDSIELGDQNTWLNDNVVYYSDGNITYRVIYELNDTQEQPASHENPKTFRVGDEIAFKPATRNGYTFVGWYADQGLTTERTGVFASDDQNVKVYAKWLENVTEPENPPSETPGQESQAPPAQTISGVIFKKAVVEVKPGKTVKNIKETPKNVTVSYKSGNKKIATVNKNGVVKGVNAGQTMIQATAGGVTTTFIVKVAPKQVKSLKLKKKSADSLKISWKKDKKAGGYQILMKTGKKGTYKVVKTIKKNKTVSFTKKKLKKGKTYYVKVRAYKMIGGKKVYGAYSSTKKVTIK